MNSIIIYLQIISITFCKQNDQTKSPKDTIIMTYLDDLLWGRFLQWSALICVQLTILVKNKSNKSVVDSKKQYLKSSGKKGKNQGTLKK